MSFDEPSLKGRALRLLGLREYSRAELERRLARYEQEPGSLAQALDELQAKGFISEQRVLESVLNRRASRLGANRVRAELQAKGLDEAVVREAVEQLRGNELERAQAVWRKKFGALAPDAAGRARQARFLAARGFAADVIRRVVAGLDDEPGDGSAFGVER